VLTHEFDSKDTKKKSARVFTHALLTPSRLFLEKKCRQLMINNTNK